MPRPVKSQIDRATLKAAIETPFNAHLDDYCYLSADIISELLDTVLDAVEKVAVIVPK
jgi:hypothetical protein